LQAKSSAIEKARAVITKLTEEMDRSTAIIGMLEKERDQLKADSKDLNRKAH
jgi:hypothetical protein